VHIFDKYVVLSNIQAEIAVKEGVLAGVETGGEGAVCVLSIMSDLEDDIVVLEKQYAELVKTFESWHVETPPLCKQALKGPKDLSSTTSVMPTKDFDRYLTMSSIQSQISMKEGLMLGLRASAASDLSVVSATWMRIADLEHKYTHIMREFSMHHGKCLAQNRKFVFSACTSLVCIKDRRPENIAEDLQNGLSMPRKPQLSALLHIPEN